MIKKILISILFLSFLFGQVKTVQDVMNEVLDDDNDALQTNIVTHFAKDDSSDALLFIDYAHHEVHQGSQFIYTYLDADFDNGDTIFFSFVTPNSDEQLHFIGSVGNSSACTVYFLEAPTIAAGKGTDVVMLNRNRVSTATSLVLSSLDSTETKVTYNTDGDLSNLGIILESYVIGAGKNKIAGATRDFNEWVLGKYKIYAFLVIGAANDGLLDLRIGWYEHTPGGD